MYHQMFAVPRVSFLHLCFHYLSIIIAIGNFLFPNTAYLRLKSQCLTPAY